MPSKLKTFRPPGLGACPRRVHRTAAGSSSHRLYGHKWRLASKAYLVKHPWCKACMADRWEHRAAQVVDHVKPHRGDIGLFWDSSNWQPLCKECHDRKTAREDGGFGRKRK
jgi:5-methylcytosine-specific restriction enzyme A